MHYVVSIVGTIAVTDEQGGTPSDADALIESHLDAVMNELEKVQAADPDIELEGCQVRLAILVEANDPDKAIAEASPVLRQAIHDAGGSTPDWPENNWKAWSVRSVTLSV